jgi:hypothetical protein
MTLTADSKFARRRLQSLASFQQHLDKCSLTDSVLNVRLDSVEVVDDCLNGAFFELGWATNRG